MIITTNQIERRHNHFRLNCHHVQRQILNLSIVQWKVFCSQETHDAHEMYDNACQQDMQPRKKRLRLLILAVKSCIWLGGNDIA